MIAGFLYALLGFIGVGLSNGLFGEFSFYINALILCALFFVIFTQHKPETYATILFGFILGLDLTGTVRLGSIFLLGGLLLGLALFMPKLLRFTTPIMQGIIGLLVVLAFYAVLPFGLSGSLHRFLLLMPLFLIISLCVGMFYHDTAPKIYEIS